VLAFPILGLPTRLAVNPANGRLYVAVYEQPLVLEIDPDKREVREISIPGEASDLAVNPKTNVIYATHSSAGTVTLIDGESDDLLEVCVGMGSGRLALDAERDISWIATGTGVAGLYGPAAPCLHCTHVVERP